MKRTYTAAVDADFIFRVAEIKRPPERVAEILDQILASLDLYAVVHPLVHDKELDLGNETISGLFSEDVIQILSFDRDIFQSNPAREAYYRFLVSELHRRLTGTALLNGVDVVTYWKRQSSLGEVLSVAMCLLCGFGLFLSDDRDSKALKQIVEQQSLGQIDIYNRQEVLDQCNDACGLPRADRKAFAHQVLG